MKLFYYTNLSGNANWAKDPKHFRQLEGLPENALAVRANHKGVPAPPGFVKGNDGEMANDAVFSMPPPERKRGRRYTPITLSDLGADQNPAK